MRLNKQNKPHMSTVKVNKHTTYTLSTADLDFELELKFGPDSEPVVLKTPTKIVVGYLCHDEDCQNPCEDQDGMGHIRSLSDRHINSISMEEAQSLLESDPDVVPLSYFEHGNSIWGVAGSMDHYPDMRWDGVKFAGVWVPDKCCRDEIALVGKNKAKRRLRAIELAEQCCKEYTSWCNGDCWGVCVDVFDLVGKRLSDDACWGYIGTEWAEEELKREMERTAKEN